MDDPNWRGALSTLQGRLPALAEQIGRFVVTAATQGRLWAPRGELEMTTARRGILVAKAQWSRVTITDRAVQKLRSELNGAARVPVGHERALRQTLGDPVAIARIAFAQPPTPSRGAAGPEKAPAQQLSRPSQTVVDPGDRRRQRRS